jgi:hydrogenase expression/formation protein HypD
VAAALVRRIARIADAHGPATLMEVCGTHTVALFRSGVRGLLQDKVRLLSGPGCPVCVTPASVIDHAAECAARPEVIVATFGDMIRVPGARSSLEQARIAGGDVRVVYSPSDAVAIARQRPDRLVVFVGVGFETTAPTVAAAVIAARESGLKNFTVLCAHKLIPPALHALAQRPDLAVHGFICPGHVSAIIGADAYRSIADQHRIPCVVTGFEPLDLLQGILMLLEQIRDNTPRVQIQYSRVVRPRGNPRAMEVMLRVFQPAATSWRGLGELAKSGLEFRDEFAAFDAARRLPPPAPPAPENTACRCAEILCGILAPPQCALFGTTCTPDRPVGPCMVSSEGACAAHFKYGDDPA